MVVIIITYVLVK